MIKEAYALAKEIQAEHFADEVVEISDDKSRDEDWEGKGNSAAVKRAELRIKTRLQLAGAANPERYRERNGGGTKVNVQTNVQQNNTTINLNHAERLAAARRRRSQAKTVEAKVIKAQDAEYTEVPGKADDWLEE